MGNLNGLAKATLPVIIGVIVAGLILNWGDEQGISILEKSAGGFTYVGTNG